MKKTPKNKRELKSQGAFFPKTTLRNQGCAIEGYRRLSRMQTLEELDEYEEELRDRFGPPPNEVKNLLAETRIRCLCGGSRF